MWGHACGAALVPAYKSPRLGISRRVIDVLHDESIWNDIQIGPQPYPVIYVVANPVRGLLDRKISEEHLQSSNESMKTNTKIKTKTTKRKEQ